MTILAVVNKNKIFYGHDQRCADWHCVVRRNKYWIKLDGIKRKEVKHVTLAGKQFVQSDGNSLTTPKHRHHLDRPETTAEPNM